MQKMKLIESILKMTLIGGRRMGKMDEGQLEKQAFSYGMNTSQGSRQSIGDMVNGIVIAVDGDRWELLW